MKPTKNWQLAIGYILIFLGIFLIITFVLSYSGCASSYKVLKSPDSAVKKKVVRMWTGYDCYYCDKAKEFFKKHKIQYIERSFDCGVCRNELFTLAKKLKFDTNKLDGVPIIVIDEDKIIVGYSPDELKCLLLNKECYRRVFNRYIDKVELKK